jgi:hypothetical protein
MTNDPAVRAWMLFRLLTYAARVSAPRTLTATPTLIPRRSTTALR